MKKTWSIINDILHKNKQNTKLPVYFKHGEKKISDKKDIADKFNAFFTNIGKNLQKKLKKFHIDTLAITWYQDLILNLNSNQLK